MKDRNTIVVITQGTNMHVLIAPANTFIEPIWDEYCKGCKGENLIKTKFIVGEFINYLVNVLGFARQDEGADFVRFGFPDETSMID